MTSNPNEIQALITEIDNLLTLSGEQLSPGQAQPRQILERIRNFLVNLATTEPRSSPAPKANQRYFGGQLSPLLSKFVGQSNQPPSPQQDQPNQQSSDISSEPTDFKTFLLPLQTELQNLLQERASLVQEIRELERLRLHSYSLTQQMASQEQTISDFLQVLTNRLVTNTTPQPLLSLSEVEAPLSSSSANPVEQLTKISADLDQKLLSLDGTVNVVFESLQRNIRTYQESLSQALARMYSTGVQGEQLLTSLINNLTSLSKEQTSLERSPNHTIVDFLAVENAITTPDIDLVSQLNQDLPQSTSNLSTDEVDELYASLFNGATNELSDTSQVQSIDSVPATPDPWQEPPNDYIANIINTNEPQENTQANLTPTVNVTVPNSEKTIEAHPQEIELISTDRITALTDLFADIVMNQQHEQLPSSAATRPPVNDPIQTSEIITENYTPALESENLFSQEQAQANFLVPDISLEEEQLQQLEQDLANFDEEINLQLQQLNEIETQELTENILSINSSTVEVPVEAPKDIDTELDKSNAEKKTEVTTSNRSSSFSTSNSLKGKDASESVWYLGIDFGTTGISATLLNRSTATIYPLYWSADNQTQAQIQAQVKPRSFRLPAEVYVPTAVVSPPQTNVEKVNENESTTSTPSSWVQNIFSAQLKPYLQICIPYKNERQKWQPVLQLNEVVTVPLVWVVRSLSKLLLTLKSDRQSTTVGLTAAAVDIEEQTFHHIINNLAGVICTCPSHCSEQYRFNLREALLLSQLVQHPQQVFFIEEGIATILSELDGASGETVKFSSREGLTVARTDGNPFLGNTLAIGIGASATEMALVDVPENLEDLTHTDFILHSFAYGGKGVEQDIVCQLLLPPKWRKSRTPGQSDQTISSNSGHWQPAFPHLDDIRLSSLAWEELNLPRPGEPDIIERIRLEQRLLSSPLGKALLDAASALKLILQHQESFTLELADQRWVLQRRDLEAQVFVPFVRRLNRELNRLLVAKGIPTEAINQAILTGGVASITAVSRWTRQKLPNAKITQDVYLSENAPICSRVAYGLSLLPLHPQVLEIPRQQYTDYFLFTELLRLVPERALSFGEVIQLFEARGINTRSCQQRLLAFLEGELPQGLIPSSTDFAWLTQISTENSEYKASTAAALFEKQGSLTYSPNSAQLKSLRQYLDAIKASTQQSLEEPYTVNFALASSMN